MKVASNGVSIHVEDQGAGSPTLVTLHYWGGAARTWDAVIAALPSRYRTVAPDLRGWGRSQAFDPDITVTFSLEDFAEDVLTVVSALELKDYVLVGHSMGGKVAQLIASRRPTGLAGLVLVAPAPPTPLNIPQEALAAMATAYDSDTSVGMAIDHMLTARPLSVAQRRQVIEDSLRGTPDAKRAWPQSTSRENISQQITHIEVPTAIIAGELDRVDSVATLREALLSRVPHAALHELADTGHLSPLEAPSEVAAIIDQFVRQCGLVH